MAQRTKLVQKALVELTTHLMIEEELFYPAARDQLEEDELLDDAAEELHVAKLLIAELKKMKRSQPRYDAKFRVLTGIVRCHFEREEGELLPLLEQSGFDLETLGQEMIDRGAQFTTMYDRRQGQGDHRNADRRRASRRGELSPGPRRGRRAARVGRARRIEGDHRQAACV